MDSNITSDRSPIIHRGPFVRLSVFGKYYWWTRPYRNQGNRPDMIEYQFRLHRNYCWLLTVDCWRRGRKTEWYQIRWHRNYSSLSSLSLYPLCPLGFNHSDTTGMDITTYSQRKRPNNLSGGYIQQIPCLWRTPAYRSIPPYFINLGYAVYYRFVRW